LDELEWRAKRLLKGDVMGNPIFPGLEKLGPNSPVYKRFHAELEGIREHHARRCLDYNALNDQLSGPFAEFERAQKEYDAALATRSAAAASYRRWLETEASWRMPSLENELKRHCLRCGTPVRFTTTVMLDRHGRSELEEFCSADCRKHYQPLASEWFPRCDTCRRFFVVIKPDGTVDDTVGAVRARREVIHPITSFECGDVYYCSPMCQFAAPVDLDDWLPVDDEAWSRVLPVPHPRLTAAGRYAEARRRALEDAKRRAATLRRAEQTPSRGHQAIALPVHIETAIGHSGGGAMAAAVAWLREQLREGEVSARDTEQAAQQQGISSRTLDRARRVLGVRSHRRGRRWIWTLQ
jgi:hypothetical protein